ncbi:hypothetical protein HYU45_00170 [Candidatus Daviesbacteria bacterium]|nr:hypothetical protein [Candidatus Daviesbacteria bacterium]
MMKKVTGYRLQVIVFLAAAVFVMFAAPATASAAPTATISAWQWNGRPGQNLTFTANATGGGSTTGVQIYRSPTSTQSWTLINQTICNGSTCSLNGSWTAETGDWYIVVNAYANPNPSNYYTGNSATECTGNPWGYNSAWSSCGSNSNIWIRISNPPTPSVSLNNTCTASDTSNLATISWAGSNPAITYVDISTNNFTSWYNKAVSGTSTNASGGFNAYTGVSGSLTLQPNTTYYTRLWDGFNLSNTASFTTPASCTPPTAPSLSTPSCPAPGTTANFSWSGNNSATSYYELFIDNKANPWGSYSTGNDSANRINSPTNTFSSTTFAGATYGWWMRACNNYGCSGEVYGPQFSCTLPNCNASPDCDLCSAPTNTCSTNNGTQSCRYTSYNGSGNCNRVSFSQSCTKSNCSSGYTCSSGTCVPPPPTANISSPANNSSVTIGQSMSVSATASGTNLRWMDIYRAPEGTQSWEKIAEGSCSGSSCTLSGSWTPTATNGGLWKIAVNAFDSYNQQCSGMEVTQPSYWTAWCGTNGTTSNITVKVVPPAPTNPASSCPIPGTTASLSWTGVSGASRYDVFVQDLAYGPLNWNTAQCDSNGLVVCQQVTSGTSYSFSTTPGKNYQWFVFACNSGVCGAAASYSTTFSCTPSPTPPTPTVSTSPACTPTNTASMYTISWASVSPAVSYVDISESSSFGTFYNKYVAGTTSTSATSGFNLYGGSGSLTLKPNTTYYVRSWNGYTTSGASTFTTPVSCTCSGYTTIDIPVDGAAYTTGNTYSMAGWGTFCSGPNGTNRNRVDLHVCDQGTSNNCRYIGSAASYPRQDVVNASWTCGNLNPNPDGWSSNWTPDSTFIGAKTLRVASVNDQATTCVSWDAKNINITPPPPPTANITAPGNNSSVTIGQSMTVSATATGTNLIKVNIFRAPKGTNNWTQIAEQTTQTNPSCSGSSCSLTTSWTPTAAEVGQWDISVNAFDGYGQQCSGMPITKPSYWTDWCGRNGTTSNVTVNINLLPPRATLQGPITAVVDPTGYASSYTATLSGGAKSGQIWITKGDDESDFNCPGGLYTASNGKWCKIGEGIVGTDTTIAGKYNFTAADTYTAAVNAYNSTDYTGTGPANQCTGTPNPPFTYDSNTWAACSPGDNNKSASVTTSVTQSVNATNCGNGLPRAEGLVTTPILEGKFGTTGKCATGNTVTPLREVEFRPFKIPTYEDLKSLYYTQSKVKVAPKSDSVLLPETEEGKVFSYTASEVNINDIYRYDKTAVIFIEGNLNINKNIITAPAAPTKGLVLVVKNNINIDKAVNQIDAVIISSGNIYTAGAACSTNLIPANALTVNGSLVSLNPGKIVFCRTLNNNSQAAEKINNQPKYLVILSNLFATTLQKWSEIP